MAMLARSGLLGELLYNAIRFICMLGMLATRLCGFPLFVYSLLPNLKSIFTRVTAYALRRWARHVGGRRLT